MRYTRAENWPGYKIVALKSRPDNNFETKYTDGASPPLVSYRTLGTKSPVCESHRQAEQEYSAVKAIVKAESQRKLDQALKHAQLAQTPRPVCLTNMYVRPGSALSQDWTTMPYPVMAHGESNTVNTQGMQRRFSSLEFGKHVRHSEMRPSSAYELLSENNRPLFLQNYKTPTTKGRWDSTEFVDQLGTPSNGFFYFRDNVKDVPVSLRANLKSNHSSENAKRQKFVFSYFRREMMREKSIVVPLGSIPATLQVKGNNTRLYNSQGHFKHGRKSWNQDQFADIPLHSARTVGHRELEARKPSTSSQPKSPSTQSSALNSTAKNKSTKPAFRDLGAVSEYKLKMASLSTESKKLVDLPQRPATAAASTYLQANKPTEHNKSSSNEVYPSGQGTIDASRLARPTSSTRNNTAFGTKVQTPSDQVRNEEHSFTGKVSISPDTKKLQSLTMMSTSRSPSFIKGVKYGEVVKKKDNVPLKDAANASHFGNEGVEGKTELLAKSPRSLTLSVFLPREDNEDSLCHRADTFSSELNQINQSNNASPAPQGHHVKNSKYLKSKNSHVSEGLKISGSGKMVAASMRVGGDQRLSDNSQSFRAISDDSHQRRLKYLHCELFGPDLCQDCQVHIDRADVQTWQQAVHPHIGTDSNNLHCHPVQRSCPSPASVGDGSDASSDKDRQLEPLTSASTHDVEVPH